MSCNRGAHNGDEHLIWGYLEPPAHLRSILRRVDLLTIDPIVTLGRAKTCDIVLPSPQISKSPPYLSYALNCILIDD
jgi:hypothetical protein